MITSTANPKIKRLDALQKKRRDREEEQVFITEGIRMFREAPEGRLRELYVSESFWEKEQRLIEEKAGQNGIRPEILAEHVFARVSDTRTPQGVLCVVKRKEAPKEEALLSEDPRGRKPFLMVLCNLQDPGNMGTILRTAEAAGVTGVFLSRDCVDLYNPKTIRSTMGSIYRMPCAWTEDIPGLLERMKTCGIHTYAAHLAGYTAYDGADYTKGCAFLIGNEGNGLPEEFARLAEAYIKIPMEGEVESLNAAVSAAVLMFEAARQRRRG